MKYSSTDDNNTPPVLSCDDRELQAAREVAVSFGGAVKNYALYPKGHDFAKKFLHTIYRQLTTFLESYEILRFDIKKGSLLYEDQTVYNGETGENNIAFLFSRDGIEWLEFTKGITAEEIEKFLDIINAHRIIDEESEGDIITALWEGEYPHIQHKTVDILSLEAPSFSFAGLQVSADQITPAPFSESQLSSEPNKIEEPFDNADEETNSHAENDTSNDTDHLDDDNDHVDDQKNKSPVSIMLSGSNDLWSLTPMEREQLQTMVDEEEYGDNTDSVIETLLISLVVQKEEADFGAVLDFIQERYTHTLKINDFRLSLKVLRNLQGLRKKYTQKKKWASPLFDNFFSAVSKPESLRDIECFLDKKKEGFRDERTEYLWLTLRLLNPEILLVIGPLAGSITLKELRMELYEVISFHARKSPETLALVLDKCNERILVNLIPIVELMIEADASKILTRMALHPSVKIREEAFRILSSRNQLDLISLFPLIDDSNQSIRQKIFYHLGKKQNHRIEALFLDYLKNKKYKQDDTEHLLTCYKTLGRCGSKESLSYLHSILMSKNLSNIIGMGSSVHKEGAALALRNLRIQKAVDILKDGAKSVLPDIRFACRKALTSTKRGTK